MEKCIRLRNRYCDFDPPDSFRTDIARYHGIKADEPVVVSTDHTLFHSTMDQRTLSAYLYWRTKVWDRGDPVPD